MVLVLVLLLEMLPFGSGGSKVLSRHDGVEGVAVAVAGGLEMRQTWPELV